MAETATSFSFFFLHCALRSLLSFSVSLPLNVSLSFPPFLSLSLHALFLFPRSPLISRRYVEGGDDSGAEMEQLESGAGRCACLSPFSPPRSRSSFHPFASDHLLITAALRQSPTTSPRSRLHRDRSVQVELWRWTA